MAANPIRKADFFQASGSPSHTSVFVRTFKNSVHFPVTLGKHLVVPIYQRGAYCTPFFDFYDSTMGNSIIFTQMLIWFNIRCVVGLFFHTNIF